MALLLAKSMSEKYQVFFMTFEKWNKGKEYSVPYGVNHINLGVPSSECFFQKVLHAFVRIAKVKQVKKSHNIDAAISFGESANIVNCLSRSQIKTISSIRGSEILDRGSTFMDDITFRKSDRVVFISEGQRNAYLEKYRRYANKTKVIYNMCDISRIDDLSRQGVDEPMDDHTLVTVGRLVEGKCIKNMINSVIRVKEKYPDVRLLIIGDGPQRKDLEDYIVEKGLTDTVKLLGEKKNPFAYVAKARLFLNASARESFSNVVLEALACGSPVISTDCRYGPREILSTDTGYGLKDRFSLEEWGILTPAFIQNMSNQKDKERVYADAIEYLLENRKKEEEYRCKGKERSLSFDADKYISGWTEVI